MAPTSTDRANRVRRRVPARVVQHVDQETSDFRRGPQDARMVALGEELALALQFAIEAPRDSNR